MLWTLAKNQLLVWQQLTLNLWPNIWGELNTRICSKIKWEKDRSTKMSKTKKLLSIEKCSFKSSTKKLSPSTEITTKVLFQAISSSTETVLEVLLSNNISLRKKFLMFNQQLRAFKRVTRRSSFTVWSTRRSPQDSSSSKMGIMSTLGKAQLLTKSSSKETQTNSLTSIWWPMTIQQVLQLFLFTTKWLTLTVLISMRMTLPSRRISKTLLTNSATATLVSVGQSRPLLVWSTPKNWQTTFMRTTSTNSRSKPILNWNFSFTTCEHRSLKDSKTDFDIVSTKISYSMEDSYFQ